MHEPPCFVAACRWRCRSLQGLRRLNAAGYGQPGSGLALDLVYNPGGAFLAPPQAKLQPAYQQELREVRAPVLLAAAAGRTRTLCACMR